MAHFSSHAFFLTPSRLQLEEIDDLYKAMQGGGPSRPETPSPDGEGFNRVRLVSPPWGLKMDLY